MAASLCFLLCLRSFGRDFEQTHTHRHAHTYTHLSNRPSAKAPVQTDKMHKLAFTDVFASTLPVTNKTFLCHTLSAVPCVCSVCVPSQPDSHHTSKLSVCCFTSCNLNFSAEPEVDHHEDQRPAQAQHRTRWQAALNKLWVTESHENGAKTLLNSPSLQTRTRILVPCLKRSARSPQNSAYWTCMSMKKHVTPTQQQQ